MAKKICLGNETPTLATVGAQKTGTAMTPDTVVVKLTTRQEAVSLREELKFGLKKNFEHFADDK